MDEVEEGEWEKNLAFVMLKLSTFFTPVFVESGYCKWIL
jgi:hypothetical protein